MPVGMKNDGRRNYTSNYNDLSASKRSILVIRNTNDTFCLPQALSYAVWLLKTQSPDVMQKEANTLLYKRLHKGTSDASPDLQFQEAVKL